MANVCVRNKVSYPDEILSAPSDVKLQFFKESIISHRFFDDAIDQIERLVASGLQGTMILLIGPAGVGKSALGDLVCNRINRGFFDLNPDDRHTIPAALVEAWAAESIRFDWHDFYESLLVALQTPLITASLPEVKRSIAGRDVFLPLISSVSRPTLRTLRARLRRAIVMRQPSLLFVDEASNILMSPRNERVKRQANSLRSIVNRADTRLVLSGAYDLYDLVLQSGQLARRGEVIHMRPYLKSAAETDYFAKALVALQNCMPVKGGCNLKPYSDILSEQSLRCVGHLKYILLRALTVSYNLNRPIDGEILGKAFYKPAQLRTMQAEMFDGYWRVEEQRHPEDHRLVEGEAEGKTETGQKARRSAKGRRVGKAKPNREPLGGRHG